MIIANHIFKNKREILKMIGKKFETLLQNNQLQESEAKETQKDIQEMLVEAFSPTSFDGNLKIFCEKHTQFTEILKKTTNLISEYLQTQGNEAVDTLIDQNPEKWQEIAGTISSIDETNFNEWANKLPITARSKFTKKLITA